MLINSHNLTIVLNLDIKQDKHHLGLNPLANI